MIIQTNERKTYEKGVLTAVALEIVVGVVIAYSMTSGNGNVPKKVAGAKTEQPRNTVDKAVDGKTLVVYFSVPETDGVDASSIW